MGSLSNNDGNEKGRKPIGLIYFDKKTTLHVHHAFFVHFLAITARLRRKTS